MNHRSWKTGLLLFIHCIYNFIAFAQITPMHLQQFLLEKKPPNYNKLKYSDEIISFYSQINFSTAWIQKEQSLNYTIFLNDLQLSPSLGLQEKDYSYSNIESIRIGYPPLQNTNDSLEADIRITEAAIRFYNDIAYGNSKPILGYNGLNYQPGCYIIPDLLASHLSKNELPQLLKALTPALPEITAIGNKIKWLAAIISSPAFREITITANQVSAINQPLVSKLYQLGIATMVDKNIPDSLLKQQLIEAQKQFNLMPDGVLRNTLLKELNTPLAVRLQQLNLAINYYRWLYCLTQNKRVIVVNIPATYLKVYFQGAVIMEMRMIVGKRSTPTPTLSSNIDEVILYPYWHVPYSIATKELLPSIKRNTDFIDAGNYQVLNKAGQIVDPYSINWHALSRNNFPYLIRQSTGCDNALGLLKLNFYSPFGVYLHDTPNKGLFGMNKRFFSHGCMRMEKPMEMGHLVLKNNKVAIDTLEQQGCLRNISPITVHADEHMPVIVWYNPAGIDSTGRVLFFEDVYGKFNWMKNN